MAETRSTIGPTDRLRPAASDHRIEPWAVAKRVAFLAVSAIVLYVLAPGLVSVFGSWHDLEHLSWWWFIGMVLAEALSFGFVSLFTRLVLPSAGLFGITSAQLAGHALSTVVPGGAATGGAVEYRMLVKAGAEPTAVGSAMAVQGIVLTSAVFVLPVFALPAIVFGRGAPSGLLTTALIGFAVLGLLLTGGSALMVSDRLLRAIAVVVARTSRAIRRPMAVDAVHEELLEQRRDVLARLGRRWFEAVFYSVGKWLLEYLVLVLAVHAVGVPARPSLVLLAYTASAVLSMIPITPGGLGFVEAGLAGTLTLAGLSPGDAALATLAYRLVTYWLPLPAGFAAWLVFRRRQPRSAHGLLRTQGG
jgi:uncharacterized protein (TIRG00374 family)